MVKRVFNMQDGAHSAAAYTAFENAAYGSCVANVNSLKVSAASGMTARIAPGDGIISTPNSGKRVQSDVAETVTVSAANATFNRIDSVVVYIDSAVAPTTAVIDNVNNILKFAVVAGTASGNPVAPNEATIQATIGAGNSYMMLADIIVPSGVTSVNTATFIDRRHVATLVDSSNLAKKAVKADNVDFATFVDQENIIKEHVAIGYGLKANVVRVGQLVFLTVGGTTALPTDLASLSEKMPDKFCPAASFGWVNLKLTARNSGKLSGTAIIRISPTGTMDCVANSGHNEWYGTLSWFTDRPNN